MLEPQGCWLSQAKQRIEQNRHVSIPNISELRFLDIGQFSGCMSRQAVKSNTDLSCWQHRALKVIVPD